MPIRGRFSTKRRFINSFLIVIILILLVLSFQLLFKLELIRRHTKLNYISFGLKLEKTNLSLQQDQTNSEGEKYVVDSTKCKIRNLDPYDPDILLVHQQNKYISCEKRGLLTYIEKKDDVATLYINQERVKEYTDGSIYCCYSVITRSNVSEDALPTNRTINVSLCQFFEYNVTIPSDLILVICQDSQAREVYRNVHATIKIKNAAKKKMQLFNTKRKKYPSVLFIGIDSVSRTNLIRSLPSTYLFLKENGWLEFKGYNKVGDNTFPNLMALLTGLNETTTLKICDPQIEGSLDKCKMLWYSYRDLGYITAFAEDESNIGTFNNLKKGFKNEPTDYYFRAYITATETLLTKLELDRRWYCTGPEVAGERIFNLARDFVTTFKRYPNFGLFWMNSYSHDNVNAVSRMDERILSFLTDLSTHNILQNSIVIFLSDHGSRYKPILNTSAGWLENRLPFLYMWIPKWLREKHSNKYKNLIKNTKRLISTYDLYMTIQDILLLSGKNYSIEQSRGCPKCKSLFEEVDKERSCEDAGIQDNWCACHDVTNIQKTREIVICAAKFFISEIRKVYESFSRYLL
ncbi:hypothetical protein ILUMI_01134 [Ignelater luminosus]|uniref:DUF229 domain containing protein n=1 Tax=Ignelater luminosus TaxID=2038154 RepID=A0A8K0GKK1_IGNLU|nr:hypothetical protein ILUMI_01134 [Ignelater luminosus]